MGILVQFSWLLSQSCSDACFIERNIALYISNLLDIIGFNNYYIALDQAKTFSGNISIYLSINIVINRMFLGR